MPQTIARFACEACGKSYPWKQEYAGRSVKCKCGHTMRAPASPRAAGNIATGSVSITGATAPRSIPAAPPLSKPAAAAAPAIDALDDFERAVADGQYDIAPDPAPPPRKPVAAAPVVTTYSSLAAPAGGAVLGYAGPSRSRSHVEEEVAKASRVADLYVPCALIVVGVALAFVDAYLKGFSSPIFSVLYVAATTIVNLVFVFGALLIAIQLLDLGLGPIGTATLKIIAVAILPGAVSGIIGHYTWGLMSWSISLVVYYLLLFYLFDMDGQEMVIVTAIIFAVRFITSILLVVALAGWLGVHMAGAGSATGSSGLGGSGMSAIGSGDDGSATSSEESPEVTAAKHAKVMAAEIASGEAVEAREWLAPSHKNHAGSKMSNSVMLELANRFYKAGAKKVWAANVETKGQMEVCAQFIVEMPTDPAARREVINVDDKINEVEQPSPDKGQQYLEVSLD